MTHEAARGVFDFGTGSPVDGESVFSAWTKAEANTAYLFALADSSVRKAATVAAMTSLVTPMDGDLCVTAGWRNAEDEGGNVYVYDAASAATCDGGAILDGAGGDNSPANTAASYAGTGTGRWRAIDLSQMHAMQWGCYGDGTTDDSPRLTAWSNHASAWVLNLGGRTYAIDFGGWSISTSGKTIRASGGGVVAIWVSTVTNNLGIPTMIKTTADGVLFVGVEINGGGFGHCCFTADGSTGVTMRRCKVHNSSHASAAGVDFLATFESLVESCEIYDHDYAGLRMGEDTANETNRGRIVNCYIHDNGDATTDYGLLIHGADIEVIGNRLVSNFGAGLGVTVNTSTRMTIHGNVVYDNNEGIINDGSGRATEVQVKDNLIADNAVSQIDVDDVYDLSISGNIITSNFGTTAPEPGSGVILTRCKASVTSNDIVVGDVGTGVQLNNCTETQVVGNRITGGILGVYVLATFNVSEVTDDIKVGSNLIFSSETGSVGIKVEVGAVAALQDCYIDSNQIAVVATGVEIDTSAATVTFGVLEIHLWSNQVTDATSLFVGTYYTASNPVLRDDGNSWNPSVFSASAAPTHTAGIANKIGDRYWNDTPTTGQPVGWVCTVAGTPGTWKGFGTVL